jgi:hypothetical protein
MIRIAFEAEARHRARRLLSQLRADLCGCEPGAGPVCPASPRQSAATPATCGVAMLVPDIVVVPPPIFVDVMHTPGPAIVCAASGLPTVVKLLKLAATSSDSKYASMQVGDPSPPGTPSSSDIAVTVRTSS